ncbi:hypothetical protein B0H17DRAFT_467708 [Mycena rosella]|uniref:Uncharacterized protein n=1 Tax=Mycena rosella TaxID=1033263 RepID=A0AAD7C6H8_MYCRO|nr:hypothetical protein B0H17DRAFT_467708 [Mycena rosella]
MFITKSLLTAAMLVGAANAFTGTANLGFTGVTICGCSPSNGPFAVAIPAALAGTHVCCNEAITLSYNGKSVTAIYSGTYDAGAGTRMWRSLRRLRRARGQFEPDLALPSHLGVQLDPG